MQSREGQLDSSVIRP
nr:unnamed protein product [Callosobruchus chinensis]